MPRIDPLQLLTCLSVLLSPDGGILSRDEVPRLVNLMTKFSKKLVSKCVYVLILKNTETSLVDMFMAEGGWTLIQSWLQDGAQTGNWSLVKEILELMLVTPVDVDRLKTNSLPKLIKNLSRREDLGEVAQISNQIVQKWLSIVKGTTHNPTVNGTISQPQADTRLDSDGISTETKSEEKDNQSESKDVVDGEDVNSEGSVEGINSATFYKVSVKDGKQVIRKLSVESDKDGSGQGDDDKMKESDKDKQKSKSSSSRSSSKSSSSSNKDKNKDRDRDKKKSSSSSSSPSSKSKSSSTSRDKERDRKDKDRERDKKDKNKSSSSRSSSKSSDKDRKDKDKSKSSSSSDSKSSKEKQPENDKDNFDKLKTNSLDKLGRIPKKSTGSSEGKEKEDKSTSEALEKKKPSFSILNRKTTGEERTKTVKVFNSKMRSTGLEEEAKPPPPRSSTKKPTPSVQLPTIPPKRPSPPREPSSNMPPEKKIKIDRLDIPDRPGAIKLIPPKPKPAVLQESDMFMDALTAAAPKKEAKKRKRRLSVTKEVGQSSPASESPQSSETPATQAPSSPTGLGLKTIAPFNFYQDTLSQETGEDKTEEEKEPVDKEGQTADTPASPPTPTDTENAMEMDETLAAMKTRLAGGLKGVLLFTKKKGPKRSIKWKADDDLVEVRYFELDETERVNVTKTFNDMAKMELSSEREALIMSRKLPSEDVMEVQMVWRPLFLCEQSESLVVPGSKSLEKDIQFAREKTAVPALYFDKRRIPDSPEEPIPENHQISDPVIIPLEDPEGQEIDLRQTPWPEPKNTAPQTEPQIPPIYPNMPFNGNFNNMPPVPFMGLPNRFPVPPGPHGPVPPGAGNFGPPNMMHNNMMAPPMNQPDMMNSGMPMNPPMFGPGPDGFIPHVNNDPNFPMQQFNGPQGPNMNMYGPNNFNHRGGGRGGFRRGGNNNGGWVQMNPGQRPWQRGGGGPRGGRLCKNKQNHGYCRNEPKCPFIH